LVGGCFAVNPFKEDLTERDELLLHMLGPEFEGPWQSKDIKMCCTTM
jgi:hypothetical protein